MGELIDKGKWGATTRANGELIDKGERRVNQQGQMDRIDKGKWRVKGALDNILLFSFWLNSIYHV